MKSVSEEKDLLDEVATGRKAVLFTASWCPFCRRFSPSFDAAASTMKGWEPVECWLEDESNPLWTRFHVEAVPTVLFFEDGKVARRLDAKLGIGLREGDLREALAAAGAL